jgi:hypothetical protein
MLDELACSARRSFSLEATHALGVSSWLEGKPARPNVLASFSNLWWNGDSFIIKTSFANA